MQVTRREVLEALANASDAVGEEMTTLAALASALDADQQVIAEHIERLVACELAIYGKNGEVRVTVTGEELLELDTDNGVIIDLASP